MFQRTTRHAPTTTAPEPRPTAAGLAAQRFEHDTSQLAYLDALPAVDGLCARRKIRDQRLSRLAVDGRWWATVAHLRCFRGIDTLAALAPYCEAHDWQRVARAPQMAFRLELTPALSQSGEKPQSRADHQDRLELHRPAAGRGGHELRLAAAHRGDTAQPPAGSDRTALC